MDKIIVQGLEIFAYHGVNEEEKEHGQRFLVDIVLYVNINKACRSDNVEDTVSYSKVIKTVKRAFTAEKYNLLEKCAQVTADAILDEFSEVYKAEITVKKPEAPIKANVDWVGINIVRDRT